MHLDASCEETLIRLNDSPATSAPVAGAAATRSGAMHNSRRRGKAAFRASSNSLNASLDGLEICVPTLSKCINKFADV